MNYTKEYLNNLNLYHLRNIGKSIGVKSPTLANKSSLIQKILDVQSGKTAPYFTKKGRPSLNSNGNFFAKRELLTNLYKKLVALDDLLLDIKRDIQEINKD